MSQKYNRETAGHNNSTRISAQHVEQKKTVNSKCRVRLPCDD